MTIKTRLYSFTMKKLRGIINEYIRNDIIANTYKPFLGMAHHQRMRGNWGYLY